jgi:LPXTG-motif cell wall-anchored protein
MSVMRRLSTAIAAAGLLLMALSVGVATADTTNHIKEANERYAFTPKTTTIAVGDKVTWVNDSDAKHTVDADDGSFDHGAFAKGASVSQTFTTAGTFAYHCDIHPYMHGTVVVLAAGLTPPATDTVEFSGGLSKSTTWMVLIGLGALLLLTAIWIRRRTRTA